MYLHKTKNGHYTPPCCYFSGELEVVECLHDKISCVLMVYGGVKNTCGNGQFCIDIRPYFTLKTIYCAVVRLVCNVHLYSVVLSNGQKILFSYRVDIIIDEHLIV